MAKTLRIGVVNQPIRLHASALASALNLPLIKRGSAGRIAQTKARNTIAPFARFDAFREKGIWLNIPGPADTIDQNKNGVRSALADVGIGYIGWTHNTFANNQLPNAARKQHR
ncbi:hypothetical protein ACQPTN_06065 [Bradyrhizobium sp. 13971]